MTRKFIGMLTENTFELLEAVHANQPELNKRIIKLPPKPSRNQRINAAITQSNRDDLAAKLLGERKIRDNTRESNLGLVKDRTSGANYHDNRARELSQTGGKGVAKEFSGMDNKKAYIASQNKPRAISSAKQ